MNLHHRFPDAKAQHASAGAAKESEFCTTGATALPLQALHITDQGPVRPHQCNTCVLQTN